MKKIFLSILTFGFALNINAQGKFKLGIQMAGTATTSNLIVGTGFNKNAVVFASPTLVSEIKLGNSLSLRPGLGFQRSGYNVSSTTTSGTSSLESSNILNINNLNIPLDLTIPIKIKENRLLINIGPNVLYGLGGKIKRSTTVTTGGVTAPPVNSNYPIPFGTTSSDINPMNLGGKVGLGFQSKGGLEANASYLLGLSDMDNTSTIFKNNTLALGVAYFFLK